MSSGSSGHDPKYTSFNPNALADGSRSNESPAPEEQRSGNKMEVKDEARGSQTKKHAEKENSKGTKTSKCMVS